MVKINQKEVIVTKDGITPVMRVHTLICTRDTKQFKKDETVKTYVAEMDNNRFAVWDSHWTHHNKYEVFSQEELHKTFNEVL